MLRVVRRPLAVPMLHLRHADVRLLQPQDARQGWHPTPLPRQARAPSRSASPRARSQGGGSKRLFRKVNNRSSAFYPHENTIRRKGSYIYEEFLSTGGTDIKVYTCGPSYVHAEARKAPTLDGIVIRDIHNKEQRFPISLNPQEKLIARKVVLAFGMRFCGFDILKSKNKSKTKNRDVS